MVKDILSHWWCFFIYKPDSKEIYWEKIISSIVVFLLLGFIFYYRQTKSNRLDIERNMNSRYAIGTTTTSYNNIKGSRYIHYYFIVYGNKFEGSDDWNWLDNSINSKGGRYYVQFAASNPSNAKMLFNYPVPDNVIESPDSGWVNMPGYQQK